LNSLRYLYRVVFHESFIAEDNFDGVFILARAVCTFHALPSDFAHFVNMSCA
jgi:hypothetical protein